MAARPMASTNEYATFGVLSCLTPTYIRSDAKRTICIANHTCLCDSGSVKTMYKNLKHKATPRSRSI